MRCPVDGATLTMGERHGVEIDYCPECRGIWLDRGELDRIIDSAAANRHLDDDHDRRPGDHHRDDDHVRREDQNREEPGRRDRPARKGRLSILTDLLGGGED